MDYQKYVNQLDEETVTKLRTAIELGRWENGDRLSGEQTEHAMQAVMLWQATHEIQRDDEPFKVNEKGEFSVGKGGKLTDTPLEHKIIDDENLIFSSKK